MNKFRQIISSLVDQIITHVPKKEFLISIYLPIDHNSRLEIKQKLKSLLFEGLRNDGSLKDKPELHNRMFEYLESQIDQLEDLEHGLAIFIRFDIPRNAKDLSFENLSIISLPQAPKAEFYLGKIYLLDQLIWIENNCYTSIILNINNKNTSIYRLEDNDLTFLANIEAPEIIQRNKEYMGTSAQNVVNRGGTVYGNGERHFEGTVAYEKKEMLKNTFDYLKNIVGIKDINYLVTLYSDNFNEVIKDFVNEQMKDQHQIDTIFLNKNIEIQNEMKNIVIKSITKEQTSMKKEFLNGAKEDAQKFANGWNKVADAVFARKVDTLFITPSLSKEGYVLDDQIVYLEPVKNSRKVRNIVPWLIKLVIDSGGKIIVVKDIIRNKKDFISAKLRF